MPRLTTSCLTGVLLLPGTGRARGLPDADGTPWVACNGSNCLIKVDPAGVALTEVKLPDPATTVRRLDIAVIDGIVWYNESGVRPDPLVRVDPTTETFQSWPIPSGSVYAGIVRHMRATRDGNLLIHQSSTNRIILVNLKGAAAMQ